MAPSDIEPLQEELADVSVKLPGEGLGAMIEAHVNTVAHLRNRKGLDKAELQLQHSLQGLQVFRVGRI